MNEIFSKFHDFLDWSNPVYPSMFLIAFNFLYIIVFALGQSLLSIVAWISFTSLIICSPLAFVNSDSPPGLNSNSPSDYSSQGGALSSGPPQNEEIVSYKTIEQIITLAYDKINDVVSALRYILLWKDTTHSLIILASLAFISNTLNKLNLSVSFAFYIFVHGFFLYNFLITFYNESVVTSYQEIKKYISMIPKMESDKITELNKMKKNT